MIVLIINLVERLKELLLEKSYDDDNLYLPKRRHPQSRLPVKISSSGLKKIVFHDPDIKEVFVECHTVEELMAVTKHLIGFFLRESKQKELSPERREEFLIYYVMAVDPELLTDFCRLLAIKPRVIRAEILPIIRQNIVKSLGQNNLDLRSLRPDIKRLIKIFDILNEDIKEYVRNWLNPVHNWEGEDELKSPTAQENKKRLIRALNKYF